MPDIEGRSALVGREPELGLLVTELSQAVAAGTGTVVAVVGAAGIGKTRLLAEVLDALPAGISVHRGQARPSTIEQPYRVLLEVAGTHLRDLVDGPGPAGSAERLHPDDARGVLDAGIHGWAGAVVGDVLMGRLEDLAAAGPAVVLVDDLHWADPASLEALRWLAQRCSDLPLSLVVAARPPAPGSPHAGLLRQMSEGGATTVELARLPTTVSRQLAAARFGAGMSVAHLAAIDEARGNPLLVLAVADRLRCGQAGVPSARLLAARLDELDATDLAVLQTAAVLGAPIHLDDVAAVGEWPLPVVLGASRAGRAAGILDGHEPLGFAHDLVREEVLATLPAQERRAIHRAAARVLSAKGAAAVDIASHLADGARVGDREAIAWLSRAAEELAGHVPAAALRVTDVALRLLGDEPLGDDLVLVRVQALAGVGRVTEAEALASGLLRPDGDPAIERRARRELALCAIIDGRPHDAATQMDGVARLTDDPSQRARVLAEASYARLLALDGPGARSTALDAESMARASGDRVAVIGSLSVLCLSDTFEGRLAASLVRAEEILRLAALPGTAAATPYQPWFAAALAFVELDRPDDALAAARAGRAAVDRSGATWAAPAYDAVEANARLRAGQLDGARAAAEAALAAAERDCLGVSVWSHMFLAQVEALVGGDEAVVADHLAAADVMLVSGTGQLGFEMVPWQRALHHERTGDPRAALEQLAPIWDLFVAQGFAAPLVPLGADLARIAAKAGAPDRAAQTVEELSAAAQVVGTAAAEGCALVARAWAQADPAAAGSAGAALLAAGRPVAGAAALADAAALLLAAGRRADAERAASAAAAAYAALGALAAVNRVGALLGGRGRPRRPAQGLGALTTTERLVIELVSEGLPNAEIARQLGTSKRTVESHVSAIYRKLGVTTRVGLARAVLGERALGD